MQGASKSSSNKMDKKSAPTSYRIVFMGTPLFAVPALDALHESRHHILKIVTQPDRPKGRGRKIAPPPVKERALQLGYEVFQPETIKSTTAYKYISSSEADIFIVIAFGQIIPKALLELPEKGAINLHASLLPKYRGPAPIQWAIINGEKETGVTTMCLDEGMDTGDILLSSTIGISPEDTSASLHDKLAKEGAQLILETIDRLADNSVSAEHQDPLRASYAPLLSKKDGHIDWTRPAAALENLIRGVTPWPGAYTFCGDMRLKILKATHMNIETPHAPGTVLVSFPDELRIATGEGVLLIHEIQGASGKCLCTKDFLCGCTIEPGTVLG
jgi:methionyl-tRNA formyltransferase